MASQSTRSTKFLSEEQVAKFRNDGYLVVRGFLDQDTTQGLLNRAKQLLEDFSLEGHPLTKFTTDEEKGRKHIGDDYFLSSSDKISFFFEEDAFDAKGDLKYPKERAINKFGHALHELDPAFRRVTLENEDIKAVAQDLAVHQNPSVYVYTEGGAVPIHDDSTFLYTSPPSALGFWFALEPCKVHPTPNGVLSFLPGSHKRNRVSKRFVRDTEGSGTTFEDIPQVQPTGIDWSKEPGWREEECDPGDLVLIDGLVIHKSERNTSNRSRFIYTFHMIEGNAVYDKKNW